MVAGEPADPLDTAAAGPAAVRGGALRVGGFVAGIGLGMVASAFLFRHLGVVRTGEYGQAMALAAIAGGLSDLGLTAVGLRELSLLSGEARNRLARSLLGLRLVVSLFAAIAITVFAASVGYSSTLVLGVGFGGVGLVLLSAQSALAVSMMRDLRAGWVAAFDLTRIFLSSVLVVALVVAGASLLPFLFLPIPVGVAILALNAWVVHGRVPLVPAFHRAAWRRVVRGVLPYSAAVAAATLYFYVAVPVVGFVASSKQVGYFAVSARTIQVLTALPALAVSTALPIFSRAARDDRARLQYAMGRVFEVNLILGVWAALILAIGAPLAIRLIGGPRFHPAATVLAIQAAGLGFSFINVVWATGLLSLERYRVILAINGFAMLAGTALIAVLATIDGARGAAIATAIDEAVIGVITVIALIRVDPSLSPPRRVLPAVAIAGGGATLTSLIPVPVVARVLIASAVYLTTLVLLRAIPDEVLEHMPGRLRGARSL